MVGKKWSPEDEKDWGDALRSTQGAALKTRCKNLAPWRGRSADGIYEKACTLDLDKTIDYTDRSLSDDEAKILAVIREKKITSAGEISREVNRSKEYVKEIIAQLHERGTI